MLCPHCQIDCRLMRRTAAEIIFVCPRCHREWRSPIEAVSEILRPSNPETAEASAAARQNQPE